MSDLTTIRQAARVIVDDQGAPVVQIPLRLWEELLVHLAAEGSPQHERIKALLERWNTEPNDTPEEWWSEFQAYLKKQRVTFRVADPDLGDE